MSEKLLRQHEIDESLFLRPRGQWQCWVCLLQKRWLYIVELGDGSAIGTCKFCIDLTERHERERQTLQNPADEIEIRI